MDDRIQRKTGGVTFPQGFRAAAVACGLKPEGQLDLALVQADRPCGAAAVFTRNRVAAAPVLLDRETLGQHPDSIVGVVANAGNANACTGPAGLDHARAMQRWAAEQLGCRAEQVLVMSTGVIGLPLDLDRLQGGIRRAGQQLSADHGHAAARAIMTTDTRPKEVALSWQTARGTARLGGMAKGSGMIHPDMATMLALLTTDVALPAAQLQPLLQSAVDASFNCITVDGDTSTNDTVILLASGAGPGRVTSSEELELVACALDRACWELAQEIVHDGEGARRVVSISVMGAPDDGSARRVAQTIATSPLVKTALAGGDPNWGRIIAAAGRAGVAFDPGRLRLSVGRGQPDELVLLDEGTPTAYREDAAALVFQGDSFGMCLDLCCGDGCSTVWTTDLTQEYVAINSRYRT